MRKIDYRRRPTLRPAAPTASRPCRGYRTSSLVWAFIIAVPFSGFTQPAPLEERVAKQNALFHEFYETGLKNAPERATSFGDYRYNGLLAQYSLKEIERQHAEADEF